MRLRQFDAEARQQLEADQLVGHAGAAAQQQIDRMIQILERQDRGGARDRLGEQLQRRGGDDAQCSFRSDQQLFQIVAGVVLAQLAQAGEQRPIRQHRLQPQTQIARIAEAQHVDAAGIGREVAADLASALRRQAERKKPVGIRGGPLQIGEDAAGLRHQAAVGGVDPPDLVHALQADDQRAAVAIWRCAAGEPGIAALRHDWRAMPLRQAHDRLRLLSRFRQDNCARGALIDAAPVGEIGRGGARMGQAVALAQEGLEPRDQRVHMRAPAAIDLIGLRSASAA